ncbi:OmpA family protein [Mesorhizobium sp.]|uniref:OmpA family protein n=1 Tax=Mesorhizobium sp. TaxID=1871066 RepID=UPI000FE7459A|nr:OmpA family protein [Mesorhizobium sp.]RWM26216.1 MAG: flagellar motor protein MotB [Mesorhizobium sp.]RWM41474.1 MAG: flagellar motor protein MotB [Mesorhizobium sp.]TJV54312.1 MAG: flagellar motor protein MotB [Mesorhizobium sp.]
MKRQPRILAGTAIGLLMASAPLGAYPLQGNAVFGASHGAPVILAQENCAEGQSAEACAQAGGQQGEAEQPKRKKREQQQQTQSAPAEQPAEPEQKPRRKRQDQQQMDTGQAEQAAPAEQQLKLRKKRDQQQIEAAPADQGGQPAVDEQQINPRKKKRDQQQQIEAAPADQGSAPVTDEQQPRKKKRQLQQTETAPAEQPAEQAAPATDEQQPRKKKRNQLQQTETAPAEQPAEQAAPANDNLPQDKLRKKKRDLQQQTETAPTGQAPKTEAPAGEPAPQVEPQQNNQQAAPAEGEQPLDKTKKRRKLLGQQPGTGQAVTGEQPSTKQPSSEGQATTGGQPATGEQPAEGGANAGAAAQGQAPANANEAPIFDSQKDVVRKRKGRQPAGQNESGQAGVEQGGTGQTGNQTEQLQGQQAQTPAPVDQGPPPTDDKAAQQEIQPEKFVPVTEEKGKRIELTPEQVVRDRRRPQGADVVKQFGDRVILQFNNQTFVESNEAPRITRGARNVYYEDLSGGRTREIVERDNGIQIVTIRNRNGDVIRRSRITPDGHEYVLSYVDERYYNDVDEWRDPGDDLPPMRLDISRRDYILDSEEVEDPDEYYTFLEQPPVERVQRLYSIDEVKRSARVRDIARRIDLDTLNFDFGSATISDTEVQKLEGVATAMEKLLKKNPAETFLIEGHTDAVGTPDANLALSDRRAEAVAEALTNAFGIPAENLTTQGYGEEYLKVNTPGPNRENRRVAIRRITSLVAPVASNNEQ